VYVHGGAKSAAEAKQLAKVYLARVGKVRPTLSITHPGMVNLHKGDAIKMYVKDLALNVIVWVAEVSHTVDASGHSMSVTCVFDDPMANPKALRVDENEIATVEAKKRNPGKTKQPTKKVADLRDDVPKATAGDALKGKAPRIG
jgi:hypothetical protein